MARTKLNQASASPGPGQMQLRRPSSSATLLLTASLLAAIWASAMLTSGGRLAYAYTFYFLNFYGGVFALVGLSLTVMGGLLATHRTLLPVRNRVLAQSAHRATGLLSVIFLLVHIAVKISSGVAAPIDAVVPFASPSTAYVGYGTIASWLMLNVFWTGIVRARFVGGKPWVWRILHSSAYLSWPIGILHGLSAGRSAATWVTLSYILCVILVGGGLVARMYLSRGRKRVTGTQTDALRPIGMLTPGAGAGGVSPGAAWRRKPAEDRPAEPAVSARTGQPEPEPAAYRTAERPRVESRPAAPATSEYQPRRAAGYEEHESFQEPAPRQRGGFGMAVPEPPRQRTADGYLRDDGPRHSSEDEYAEAAASRQSGRHSRTGGYEPEMIELGVLERSEGRRRSAERRQEHRREEQRREEARREQARREEMRRQQQRRLEQRQEEQLREELRREEARREQQRREELRREQERQEEQRREQERREEMARREQERREEARREQLRQEEQRREQERREEMARREETARREREERLRREEDLRQREAERREAQRVEQLRREEARREEARREELRREERRLEEQRRELQRREDVYRREEEEERREQRRRREEESRRETVTTYETAPEPEYAGDDTPTLIDFASRRERRQQREAAKQTRSRRRGKVASDDLADMEYWRQLRGQAQ